MYYRFPPAVVLFLAVLLGGLVVILGNPKTWVAFRTAVTNAQTVEFIDGRFTKTIDRAIEEQIPRSQTLNEVAAGLEYKLLGDAGPDVRPGCAGWLFLKEELAEFPNGKVNLLEHVSLAKKIVEKFSGSKAVLMAVPIPDKSKLAETYRCGLAMSAQSAKRERIWKKLTSEFLLTQIDLTANWPRPGFWRTDTHWDRTGSRFAAARVAGAINQLIGRGEEAVVLEQRGGPHERIGDLMRLAQLQLTANIFGPEPDVERDENSKIERKGGLLDEVAPPVIILAGSSFSLNSGFRDFLEVSLAREVSQRSTPGGEFAGALLDLLEKSPSIINQVKIIIWEWPMRYLTQPLTKQERTFLYGPKKS